MKNKILWMDLAVCFVWALAILGSKWLFWDNFYAVMCIILIVWRLSFTFALMHKERRAWLPMVGAVTIFLLFEETVHWLGLHELSTYPFYIMDIQYDDFTSTIILGVVFLWLFILPFVVYFVQLIRKKLIRTELTWGDMFGCILWKDRKAKAYSVLLLMSVLSLYVGLAMEMRLSLLMCIIAPVLSYRFICNYYHIRAEKLWIIAIGMVLFFVAQSYAGIIRLTMLVTSFLLVTYLCYRLFAAMKHNVLTVAYIAYLGVFLPSLCIGYNQYACIDYARRGFYSAMPYSGIFYIEDKSGELCGLRDRYKLILKPEYEHIVYSNREAGFSGSVFELRKDGYVRLYDARYDRIDDTCTIDDVLQAEVYDMIKSYFAGYESEYDDRCEVIVTDRVKNITLAHLKVAMHGIPTYHYGDVPFLPQDAVPLGSGEFVCDSLVKMRHSIKRALSYALELPNGRTAQFRIYVKLISKLWQMESLKVKD